VSAPVLKIAPVATVLWLKCTYSRAPSILSRFAISERGGSQRRFTGPENLSKEWSKIRLRKGEKDHAHRGAAEGFEALDDNALAAELVAGHHEALTILFKRHSGTVFRTARRILGDSGEAEEVVQQTFLEMYQHITKFDSAKGSFLGWLLRRAKFRAVNRRDHLNAERFYEWTAMDEAADSQRASRSASIFQKQEIEPMLDEFLRKLPARHRKVLKLTFFEGRTAEEIAVQMNESVHVVRHLLYDALKRLRSAAHNRMGKK